MVIDPQRDIDRVEKALAELGVRCAMVLETHIHNDYVTGGYDLAQRSGCPYVVSAEDQVSFDRLGVRDGDELSVGSMRVRVVATPGHTATHVSYVITVGNGTPAVFTGGSCCTAAWDAPISSTLPAPTNSPSAVSFGAAPGRRASRRYRGVPDPRVRQFLFCWFGRRR